MSGSKIMWEFSTHLNRATNPMILEPDAESVRIICEYIFSGKLEPEYALEAISKKLCDDNPHTVFYALMVLEIVAYSCGNIAQNVISTPKFMENLKNLFYESEHKKIKDKILSLIEDWVDKLKYFPKYNEAQIFMNELRDNGYTFPNSNFDALKREAIHDKHLRTLEYKKQMIMTEQIVKNGHTLTKPILHNENKNGKKESMDTNDQDNTCSDSIMEYREKKKKEYKEYRRCSGLSVSSDDDIENHEMTIKDEHCTRNGKLPIELEKIKQSKHQLQKDITDILKKRHQQYLDEHTEVQDGIIIQCNRSNCQHCEMYKRRTEPEKTFVEKRLPLEMRKVKESKENMKKLTNEYKQNRKDSYYTENNSGGSLPKTQAKQDMKNRKQYKKQTSYESESKSYEGKVNTRKTEMQGRNELCQLQDGQDEQLQIAMKLSLQEFSAKAKIVPDTIPNETEFNDMCLICFSNFKPLKQFMPCKHKVICIDCAKSYFSTKCQYCNIKYTDLIDCK